MHGVFSQHCILTCLKYHSDIFVPFFRVTAENAVGCSEPSPPSEPVSISTDQEATEPHFLRELRDAVAVEGQKVSVGWAQRWEHCTTILIHVAQDKFFLFVFYFVLDWFRLRGSFSYHISILYVTVLSSPNRNHDTHWCTLSKVPSVITACSDVPSCLHQLHINIEAPTLETTYILISSGSTGQYHVAYLACNAIF